MSFGASSECRSAAAARDESDRASDEVLGMLRKGRRLLFSLNATRTRKTLNWLLVPEIRDLGQPQLCVRCEKKPDTQNLTPIREHGGYAPESSHFLVGNYSSTRNFDF